MNDAEAQPADHRTEHRYRLSVIIPTLNESESIDATLTQLFETFSATATDLDTEVIVVDDDSDDGTAERVRRWSADYPVRLIQRKGTPDLAASVLAGARAARAARVVVMDADGSHPPETIPALLAPLEAGTHDVAIGSRHVAGSAIMDWPWYRHLTSRVAEAMAWPFTAVRDPMAGFFAVDRERLAALPDDAAGFKILLELLARHGDELRVAEVPIAFRDRERGNSKLGLQQQLKFLERVTALGSGRVSVAGATKFGLVGASGMVVDLIFFQLLLAGGLALSAAHIGSFAVATVSNFILHYRWTFGGHAHADLPLLGRYLRFLAVAMLALTLRGGVLALLVEGYGLAPSVAILPAVLVTAGINYLGAVFYVFPSTAAGTPLRVRWHLAAIGLVAYVFLLQVVYIGQLELILDEAYYWTYTRHPALSYLDHPPLTAWLIWLGTWLFGDTVFGVRAALVPLTLIGAWYVYRYGRELQGRTAALLGVLLVLVLPGYFASGMLMTPDAPLVAAWMAVLFYFKRALVDGQSRAFLGLGIAMGLGLLAKYSIALLVPAAAVFMLLDAHARRWFLRPEPYLAAGVATLIFLPVLIWNWQQDWASFTWQTTRRLFSVDGISTHMIVLHTLAMLAPMAAVAAVCVIGPLRRALAPEQRERRFMLIMTLIPLGVFALYGLGAPVKFHWAVPVWLAIVPLIARTIVADFAQVPRVMRRLQKAWAPGLLGLALLYGMVLHYLVLGLPGVPPQDAELGYLGWPEMAQAVHELERQVEQENGGRPLVAAMSKWSVAAALSFHAVDRQREQITSRNLVGEPASMWEYWFDDASAGERPVILVHYLPGPLVRPELEDRLVGLGPLESRELTRNGVRVRTLYYRIAEGYRPEVVRRM